MVELYRLLLRVHVNILSHLDLASGLLALTGGVHRKDLKCVHIHETNLKGCF